MKRSNRKLTATRLETWAMPGVPDVLVCDELGRFHMIELKHTNSNAVELRPHQVSFLTTHAHASCWILVRQQKKATDVPVVSLFRAVQAVELRMDGLTATAPVLSSPEPVQWGDFFALMFPLPTDRVGDPTPTEES